MADIGIVIELGVVLVMVLAVFVWVIFGATVSLASGFKHYSLRTLLIGITVVAVLLGAVVWAVK